jgi:hypothetical protein
MPIENPMLLVKDAEWRNQNPTFTIDPEILKWARLHADIWLKRWKEGSAAHWTTNEERSNYIGLIGQKCFEIALQQLEVPYVHNDPAIDWRGKKSYDFRIPNVGTVEIKTVDYRSNQKRLIIKCSEWHNSDFVLGIKLTDELPTALQFIGYAANKDVKGFCHAEKVFPCFESPCYWSFLTDLKPASEFFALLTEQTQKCWVEP